MNALVRKLAIILPFLLSVTIARAQIMNNPSIDVNKINIVRDSFGVPHIFAPTDPEVAYGLAWAHSQDDFTTIQTL